LLIDIICDRESINTVEKMYVFLRQEIDIVSFSVSVSSNIKGGQKSVT